MAFKNGSSRPPSTMQANASHRHEPRPTSKPQLYSQEKYARTTADLYRQSEEFTVKIPHIESEFGDLQNAVIKCELCLASLRQRATKSKRPSRLTTPAWKPTFAVHLPLLQNFRPWPHSRFIQPSPLLPCSLRPQPHWRPLHLLFCSLLLLLPAQPICHPRLHSRPFSRQNPSPSRLLCSLRHGASLG